jgi:hypothetical protein
MEATNKYLGLALAELPPNNIDIDQHSFVGDQSPEGLLEFSIINPSLLASDIISRQLGEELPQERVDNNSGDRFEGASEDAVDDETREENREGEYYLVNRKDELLIL